MGGGTDETVSGVSAVSSGVLTAPMKLMLFVASGLVFIVGIPLLFFTNDTAHYFAWTIKPPMTAAFLGSAYWASCILELRSAQMRTWAKARVAVPAVLLFTTLTFVATMIHLDKFHTHAHALTTLAVTWAWIVVYVTVPVILGSILVFQLVRGSHAGQRRHAFPPWYRAIFVAQGIPMLGYGIALFVAPASTASVWPWALTPLTGQAIGAWLISLGVIALHIAAENDFDRMEAAMPAYATLGILELISVTRYPHLFTWSSPRTWVFLVFAVSILFCGVYGWANVRPRAASAT